MEVSFLIVTRNRPEELARTLNSLYPTIDLNIHEVMVFIDGCAATMPLINEFPWVKWQHVDKNISASPARNTLYKKAVGTIFIGLDDDAHLITPNALELIAMVFKEQPQTGLIAFQEIKGIFDTDDEARKKAKNLDAYYCNEFVGCGFAVRKSVYDRTNGFPIWMDIYGEEAALSLEILDLGYELVYNPDILVNHRVDLAARKQMGRNYFRFEHQLLNSLRWYMVYFPNPTKNILKLLVHNFNSYGRKDSDYFAAYWRALGNFIREFLKLKTLRKPVSQPTITKYRRLKPPVFH